MNDNHNCAHPGLFVGVALTLSLAGCSYPNQFHNVRADSPHADLVGKGVKAVTINDQPTSFWRCHEMFRIPPGSTKVRTVAGGWDVHDYPALEFEAAARRHYILRRLVTNGVDQIVLYEMTAQGEPEKAIAQTERQGTK